MANLFPYTNTHELNLDWILQVVKDFQTKYTGFDDAVDAALAAIEAARTGSLADMEAALNTALDAVTSAKAEAIEAVEVATENAKAEALEAVEVATGNARTAITSDLENAQTVIASDLADALSELADSLQESIDALDEQEIAILNRLNSIYHTLPADSQEILSMLNIVFSVLNGNYTWLAVWEPGYYSGSTGVIHYTDNTYISTARVVGCAGRRLQVTCETGYIIYEICYWDNDSPENRTVFTLSSNTEADVQFPATAANFSITIRKSDSSTITSSDVQGNVAINWPMNAVEVPSMIAYEETTTTASIAHIVGKASEFFMLNGYLYHAISDIAQYGSIITSGSGKNVEAIMVMDQYSDLKNALLVSTYTKYIGYGSSVTGGTVPTKEGYIDTNGAFLDSASYRSTDYIEIEAFAKIYTHLYGLTVICNIAFYDSTKTFISGVSASSNWGTVIGNQEIPENAKYYRICIMNADENGYVICEDVKRVSTEQVAQVYTDIDTLNDKIEQKYKTMVSDIVGSNGYIDSNGTFNSTASWIVTDYIPVLDKTEISEHVNAFTTVPYAVYYDKYKVFIGGDTAQNAGVQNIDIDVPSNAYYIRLNMLTEDRTQYYEYTEDKLKSASLNTQNNTDPLYGKKIGAVGDSITIGTYSVPGMTYVNQIANAHNMTVDNQAIWGSVFPAGKTQEGQPQGSIYSQIANVADDCDMLIISGGINDADYYADSTYWGAVSGGYDATLDTTTFCGAFEGTLKAALNKFKGKPILFVFEHRMTQKYQSQYGQHFEDVQYPLMIEMLNKWGIPYVDLFHDMPSIKLTPGYIQLYSFDNQGIHPNIAGYRKFYVPRVESGLVAIAK